ncbi:hypothetical protein [Stenotrophomonas phage CM2]
MLRLQFKVAHVSPSGQVIQFIVRVDDAVGQITLTNQASQFFHVITLMQFHTDERSAATIGIRFNTSHDNVVAVNMEDVEGVGNMHGYLSLSLMGLVYTR